ncbi:hypothetical protein ACIPRL_07820 [Streptomyces sp. NPDC090085]|uniref:hypothetical protein n=1 Tax=Streptomyces sp. NPDC090085 TaxID=3365943 RepID=UPI00380E2701
MKLPRTLCPRCSREVALTPVSGAIGVGQLYRHDESHERTFGPALVSCPGSLQRVPIRPHDPVQMELTVTPTFAALQASLFDAA